MTKILSEFAHPMVHAYTAIRYKAPAGLLSLAFLVLFTLLANTDARLSLKCRRKKGGRLRVVLRYSLAVVSAGRVWCGAAY